MPVEFRKDQIRAVEKGLVETQDQFMAAIYADLHVDPGNSFGFVFGDLLGQIKFILSELDGWVEPRPIPATVLNLPCKNFVEPQARGVFLVIGAWNFSINVTLGPLLAIIAAGNCAVMRPSELSPKCSDYLTMLCENYLDPRFYRCIGNEFGGLPASQALTELKWDGIVYTGSGGVGRIIAAKAAQNLTPCILELGGKCPVVVHKSSNWEIAIKRIISAKFTNCGQICVNADYVLIDSEIYEPFKAKLGQTITDMYTETPISCPDYSRIISSRHAARIWGLVESQNPEKIIYQGGEPQISEKFIPPVILESPD